MTPKPQDDEELVRLMQEVLAQREEHDEAEARVLEGAPVDELARAPQTLRDYVEALETERERLQSELEGLREELQELEITADRWYVENADAEIETFGEGAEDEIDWELLVRERQRARKLEAVAAELFAVERFRAAGDSVSMRAALKRMLERLGELESPTT